MEPSIFAFYILYCVTGVAQNHLLPTPALDKIKGGWAGQTIVTFGGPVSDIMVLVIQEYQPIPGTKAMWQIRCCTMILQAMTLTWISPVEVLERDGLNATRNAFAQAHAQRL